MESLTNKGKHCFVYFGNKYTRRYRTKRTLWNVGVVL